MSEKIKLTCQSPECVAPNFERERQKGRQPKFCPSCSAAKNPEKAPVELTCSTCEKTWLHTRSRGADPSTCPTCKAQVIAEQLEDERSRARAKAAAKIKPVVEEEEIDERPAYIAPEAPIIKKGRDIVKIDATVFANGILFAEIEQALVEVGVPLNEIHDPNNTKEFLVRAIVECARSGVPKLGPIGQALVVKYEVWANKLKAQPVEELLMEVDVTNE